MKYSRFINSAGYLLFSCLTLFSFSSYAAEPSQEEPMVLASNTFVFNPNKLRWTAINSNGQVLRSGRASGGRGYCPDTRRACRTPTGSFQIIAKKGANCRSTRYPVGRGGSPMPYCMFFSKYYAVHGSYDVPNYNASHGCIRIAPADARWLYHNFMRIGTKVIVRPY